MRYKNYSRVTNQWLLLINILQIITKSSTLPLTSSFFFFSSFRLRSKSLIDFFLLRSSTFFFHDVLSVFWHFVIFDKLQDKQNCRALIHICFHTWSGSGQSGVSWNTAPRTLHWNMVIKPTDALQTGCLDGIYS